MYGAGSEADLVGTDVMMRVHPGYRLSVTRPIETEVGRGRVAGLMQ